MNSNLNNKPHVQRENDKKLAENLPTLRRGWLKNGNLPGDFTKATRCSASSKRTGLPCLQPAMTNSKCRLHGGKSTGPKTVEGLERSRKANWKHGYYSAKRKLEFKRYKRLLSEAFQLLGKI